jgi:hypothetical protein
MSAAFRDENSKAKELLATLKSGAPLKGTVRAVTMNGSTPIACVAVELPLAEQRQVLVQDEHHLPIGTKVVLQCVPNPLHPERFMFRIASEAQPERRVITCHTQRTVRVRAHR